MAKPLVVFVRCAQVEDFGRKTRDIIHIYEITKSKAQ